jgi:hypothetical protein
MNKGMNELMSELMHEWITEWMKERSLIVLQIIFMWDGV